MTAGFNSNFVPIKDFDAAKQTKLFQAIRTIRYSGQLCFRNKKGIIWVFFLYMGRVIYITGGMHPVRRWRRNITLYFPQVAENLSQELKAVDLESQTSLYLTWDYHLLHLWLEQKKIDIEQVKNYIRALIDEFLFDLTQANTVSFHLTRSGKQSFQPLTMIDPQRQIDRMGQLWKKWQELSVSHIYPDLAPYITDSQKLRENTSEKTYQGIIRLVNGKQSIRDIVVQKKSSELTFLRSISSYITEGMIGFYTILDIALPLAVPHISEHSELESKPTEKEEQKREKPLIICVAAKPIISQIMTKVAIFAGCNVACEYESEKAMPLLLQNKPDIIFLESDLPKLSGYEVCSQLRQVDHFANTPIILLGQNISLIERMKAKMSGASEIFPQSMDVRAVMDLVKKYMRQISTSEVN